MNKEILKLSRKERTEYKIKINFSEIYQEIILYTKLLNINFSRKLWHFLNNTLKIPNCKICNSVESKFNPNKFNYTGYCSKKCAANDQLVKDNRYKKIKEKYGTENLFQSEYFINKRKETLKEKYGENFISNEKIQNKIKETYIKRYGKDSIFKTEDFLKNRKETWNKIYGVNHPQQNKIITDKRKETLFEKYETYIKNKYNHLNIIKINKNRTIDIICNKCNKNYNINSFLLHQRINVYSINPCLNCNPLNSYRSSGKENEIREFIESLNIETKIDRTILNGDEIDIFIPLYNLGFEHNGVYWHNEFNKPKDYHLDKTALAKEKGVKLVHIWEDDWITKQEIIKSRILNLLNLSPNKIYARKCIIKTVNSSDSREFLNRNHLQGNVNAAVKLGLYYNNELVSLMTFGKLRKNLGQKAIEGDYELTRFANKLNISVIGGASRLFKYFIKEYKPERLISYADCDWTVDEQDNLYTKLRFKYIGHTGLNYWWVVDGIRENRFKFRKDKLVKEGADPSMTEVEIMHDRGCYRCFGTGNYKFEWKKS